MDITKYLKAKSDQLNSDDLVGGPIVVQITKVTEGSAEQPVVVHISGGHCPWKPCKGMLRFFAVAWGTETDEWAGRWLELYCEPTVQWAGKPDGGVRLSGMSDIPEPELTVRITVARNKKVPWTVRRLDDPKQSGAPTANLHALLEENSITIDQLDAWRAEKGKCATEDLTDEERAGFAGWLAANPNALKEISQCSEG